MKRGLVDKPEDWVWSSYRHYLSGEESVVEIESLWKAPQTRADGNGTEGEDRWNLQVGAA